MTPGSWETVAIEEVCEILDRLRKPITKRDRKPGPYPYYGASGILDQVEGYIFDEPLVLLGEDGAKWEAGENSAFPINGKTWVNNHAHVMRPDRERLLDEWLIYYLNFTDLLEYVSGLTVPKLNQKSLKAIPIPLPPLSEQRRIVSVLDAAFAGLATATAHNQKNLQNARELFESYADNIFRNGGENWETHSLGNHIDLLSGFAFKSRGYTDSEDSIRLLRGDNIMQGYFRWDKAKRWPIAERDEYKRYELEEGDVVLAMDRTWIQAGVKYAVMKAKDLPCLLVQRVARLRPRTMGRRFLAHLLGSRLFTEYVLSIQTGLGVPHISGKQIQDFAYQAPSEKEQVAIGNQLDDLKEQSERLIAQQERKLAALSELKQSLLHRAFRGELSGGASGGEAAEQLSEASA